MTSSIRNTVEVFGKVMTEDSFLRVRDRPMVDDIIEERHIMESRRSTFIAPSMRVMDMQTSLAFYTHTSGSRTSGRLTRKDGQVVHPSVGFDSPMLMLSALENDRTVQPKENPAGNIPGVKFYIGTNSAKKLDAFFTQVKAKGIKVINEPTSKSGETGYSF